MGLQIWMKICIVLKVLGISETLHSQSMCHSLIRNCTVSIGIVLDCFDP